jgi:hypothetical protein
LTLLRDELLNETLFRSLPHTRAVLKAWRADYNTNRSHSLLGWTSPATTLRNGGPLRFVPLTAPLRGTAAITTQQGNAERQTPIAAVDNNWGSVTSATAPDKTQRTPWALAACSSLPAMLIGDLTHRSRSKPGRSKWRTSDHTYKMNSAMGESAGILRSSDQIFGRRRPVERPQSPSDSTSPARRRRHASQ